MLRRNARRLALGVWLATMAVVAFATVLLIATFSTPVPNSWGFRGASQLAAVTTGSIGAVILRRQPLNAIGWLFAGMGVCFAVEAFAIEYTIAGALAFPGQLPFVREVGWTLTWIWLPSTGAALIFLPLLFPTGRLASPRWRPVAWLGVISIVLFAAALAVAPGPLVQAGYIENPLTIPGIDAGMSSGVLQPLALVPFGLAIVLSLTSLFRRFRTSTGDTRQQIKWFAFAASLEGAVFALYIAAYLLEISAAGLKAFEIAVVAGLLGIPLAAGIAILRYRLYDIDRIISRTLAYALVTAVLAAVFVVVVLAMQAVLSAFTQRNTLAVAASTLVVAALFQPIRARVQRTVDRRFDRARYDAERTITAFSARLRDHIDLAALRIDIGDVVQQTMAPTSLGVWLQSQEDRR